MKRRRHATVEPVFGVLTQYLGMRKVMTKGIHNCNKQFIMAAIAYNLKKYLKFEHKLPQSGKGALLSALIDLFRLYIDHIWLNLTPIKRHSHFCQNSGSGLKSSFEVPFCCD